MIVSLPEEKGFLRLVRIPELPSEEIRGALEFQLEEHIPYPPEDLIFDYQLLGSQGGAKGEINVVVTAYPRALVESYLEAITKAGFMPIIFELESQAVSRAVVPRWATDALLVGDIGKTRTTFSTIFRRTMYFTSTVKVGGRDINAALMQKLHVNPEEASEIKMGRGFDFSS